MHKKKGNFLLTPVLASSNLDLEMNPEQLDNETFFLTTFGKTEGLSDLEARPEELKEKENEDQTRNVYKDNVSDYSGDYLREKLASIGISFKALYLLGDFIYIADQIENNIIKLSFSVVTPDIEHFHQLEGVVNHESLQIFNNIPEVAQLKNIINSPDFESIRNYIRYKSRSKISPNIQKLENDLNDLKPAIKTFTFSFRRHLEFVDSIFPVLKHIHKYFL